jgi:heme exporter protein D
MQWHSVNEFLAMGGYGLYVWGSFGSCALAMVVEPWLVRRRRLQIMKALRRQRRAELVSLRWATMGPEATQ